MVTATVTGPALDARVRMRTSTKAGLVVGLQLSNDCAWILWDGADEAVQVPYRFLTPIGA